MKKLLSLCAVAMLLASCSNDEIILEQGAEQDVTFSVAIPEAIGSRAATGTNSALGGISNTQDAKVTFSVALYEGAVKVFEDNKTVSGKEATFTPRLIVGQTYDLVAYANINGNYVSLDTNEATVTAEGAINDESKDAYYCSTSVKAEPQMSAVLTRPYGKMRIVATDMNTDAMTAKGNITNISIAYAEARATDLCPATGEWSGTAASTTYASSTVTEYTGGYDANDGCQTILVDYIPAPAEQETSVKFTVTVEFEHGDSYTREFAEDIPVRRNHLTTIIGDFFTAQSNLKVRVDEEFADEIEIKPFASKTEMLALLKKAVDNGETDIVLDAQGAEIENFHYAFTTSLVPAGVTVTIKNANVQGTSRWNYADGTLIFENCTFNAGFYSINFDGGKGDLIFKNCVNYGWNSFAKTLNKVSFYDSKLYGDGTYAVIQCHTDLYMENCLIDISNANLTDAYADGVNAVNGGLTLVNCTQVAASAGELSNALAVGMEAKLTGTVDMQGETVVVADGASISGGTVQNVTLQVEGDGSASFDGVAFDATTTVQAAGDGALSFTGCTFEVEPQKIANNSRYSAIVGNHQYSTIDMYLEDCVFNYSYDGTTGDKYNAAIFMWSSVKNAVIKNCKFNDYGFVAVKLMNVAEGANILFEGNTFNMCESTAANYWGNNAVQIVPQHDNTVSITFTNNVFTGDYEQIDDNDCLVYVNGMNDGFNLTKLTFTQSGNKVNGADAVDKNFVVNPVK